MEIHNKESHSNFSVLYFFQPCPKTENTTKIIMEKSLEMGGLLSWTVSKKIYNKTQLLRCVSIYYWIVWGQINNCKKFFFSEIIHKNTFIVIHYWSIFRPCTGISLVFQSIIGRQIHHLVNYDISEILYLKKISTCILSILEVKF